MRNVGTIDRWIRIIGGIILLGAFLLMNVAYQWFWIVGAILLLTGVFGYCPSYSLFRVNTRKTKIED